jgi:hypothetical protein
VTLRHVEVQRFPGDPVPALGERRAATSHDVGTDGPDVVASRHRDGLEDRADLLGPVALARRERADVEAGGGESARRGNAERHDSQ